MADLFKSLSLKEDSTHSSSLLNSEDNEFASAIKSSKLQIKLSDPADLKKVIDILDQEIKLFPTNSYKAFIRKQGQDSFFVIKTIEDNNFGKGVRRKLVSNFGKGCVDKYEPVIRNHEFNKECYLHSHWKARIDNISPKIEDKDGNENFIDIPDNITDIMSQRKAQDEKVIKKLEEQHEEFVKEVERIHHEIVSVKKKITSLEEMLDKLIKQVENLTVKQLT